MASDVQTVLVPRSRFSLAEAKAWVRHAGFTVSKVDTTANYYRFRQHAPGGYARFATKSVRDGVKLVIGFKGGRRRARRRNPPQQKENLGSFALWSMVALGGVILIGKWLKAPTIPPATPPATQGYYDW